jgi:hypothetical protein
MVVGLLTLLLAFLFAEQYQGREKFENEIRQEKNPRVNYGSCLAHPRGLCQPK